MPEYNVHIGAFVRVYGSTNIKARNDKAAVKEAMRAFKNDAVVFEEHDWNNLALPSIVTLTRADNDKEIELGKDFAATLEDARDLRAADMMEMLTQARAWINDDCERRGDEDKEYSEPASKIVDEIDALLKRAKTIDV